VDDLNPEDNLKKEEKEKSQPAVPPVKITVQPKKKIAKITVVAKKAVEKSLVDY